LNPAGVLKKNARTPAAPEQPGCFAFELTRFSKPAPVGDMIRSTAPERSTMSTPSSDPDLIKVTELLLIPNSFLVAALGTADTNAHRAAVSILGLVVSLLWWVAVHDAWPNATAPSQASAGSTPPVRTRVLYWLPIVFAFGWLISTIVHAMLWSRPLAPH
jgi:hypothetical protein